LKFGEFDSDGASSTGVKEKVENSSKIQFFSKNSEKMHFLNFKTTKKIAMHLKKFFGMQNVVSKLFQYPNFAFMS